MTAPDPADRMVELVTCSTAYESSLVQGLLVEAGIPFQKDEMTPQFAFTAGEAAVSRVRVPASDLDRANLLLSSLDDEAEEVTETPEEQAEALQARRNRRYAIARFFLVGTGLAYLVTAIPALGAAPIDGIVHAAVGAALIVLAHLSYRKARLAFLVSFLIIAIATMWGMLLARPFLILPGIGVLLSSYFAHQVAKESDEAEREQEPA